MSDPKDSTDSKATAESTPTPTPEKPLLVLHLDINKTLILMDPVSGMDMPGMLQSIVSECSWGKVDPETGKWVLDHTEALFTAPSPEHTTYSDFLEYGEFVLTENPNNDPAIKAQNKKRKKGKKIHKKTFTEPGNPGELMRPVFERMLKMMRIPEEIREACSAHPLEHFHADNIFVLPSIYWCLNELQKEGRRFSIVLRTFGTELDMVSDDFNAFRAGTHPFMPNPVCTNATYHSNGIEIPKNCGGLIRAGTDDVKLVLGTLTPKEGEPTRVITGMKEIYDFVTDNARQGINLGLRDDYAYWAHHAEGSHAGKLLAVDPTDETVHHIFFDDNVERDFAHIVDCRDVSNGNQPVPFEHSLNRYLVKAEPVQALLDHTFFRRQIALCEANLASDRRAAAAAAAEAAGTATE